MVKRKKWTDSVSIVIPAYNEQQRIVSSLKSLSKFCEDHFEEYEILCVDDGSTDRTWDQISRQTDSHPGIKALSLPYNKGKGYAVKHGMLKARGRFRFFTDADLPYCLDAFILAMEAFYLEDSDIVTGARDLNPGDDGLDVGMWRKAAGRAFSAITHYMVRLNVRDSQCGFKALTDEAAIKLFSLLKTNGYAFDVELFTLARLMNMKISKIPVILVKQVGSKIRLPIDPLFMFLDLIKIAIRVRKMAKHK